MKSLIMEAGAILFSNLTAGTILQPPSPDRLLKVLILVTVDPMVYIPASLEKNPELWTYPEVRPGPSPDEVWDVAHDGQSLSRFAS